MNIKDLPLDKAKKAYIIYKDNTVEEVQLIADNSKHGMEKHKDSMYLVFLGLGILSFALGALISYKKLNGKG
jgi:hypothetical protein